MPRPFITGQRPQPRPGVRPTQYMPPQQQPVQAVSRYCTFCGMTGHTEEVCRKRKGTCFACGAQGHQMRDCPKKKGFVATTGDISGTGIGTGRRVNKPTIKARAFALGQDEVQGSPAVVGARHASYLVEGGDRKARKFETGLNPDIQEAIAPLNISDYHEIVDRALNIERTLGFTRAKRAQMSLSRPPVPQWQAGRFPSTSGGGKFFRTDMRSIAYTPRPQTQGFMPRPFITGQRPQPRPGVRPTQYMPPQQQPVQAVSRYCTFCGMTGHTEEVCRKRKGTCFACGAQGHQMRDCPKKKGFVATTGDISGTGIGTGRRVNKPTIKARAFALGQDEVQGSPAVVGARHASYLVEGGDRKARKFETGLNPDIQEAIAPLNISDYHEIVDRALNIERTLGFTRAKRAQMSLSRPPVPQWQAGRFPSTSGGGKFFRTDMRSIAYTPRPQTQGFMPRPFITGQRPQPRPGVRPTQYMPPQQQPVQAVSRYCTFCGMTGHTEEVCRKRKGTCFACGAQGHQMRDCPKKKGFVATTGDISGTGIGTGRRVNKPTIKARAFALGQDEVQGSPAVVG
ncbi:hypothetical protein RJ639_026245, partial [Escallonia herrerae]